MLDNTAQTGWAARATHPQKARDCMPRFCSSFVAEEQPAENLVPGWRIMHYPCLDSTNLEARRLILSGVTEKSVIVADSQTNEQCRHDRL